MTRVGPCLVMFAALTLSACGPGAVTEPLPADWMIGEYSGFDIAGLPTDDVERLAITADGFASFYSLGGCCDMCNDDGGGDEFPWQMDGDDVIIWIYGEGESSHYRVTHVDCNTIAIHTIHDGEEVNSYEFHRGEMCLQDLPCEGVECDPCETVWCEGSPPPSCE
jgi:hypothetical protein